MKSSGIFKKSVCRTYLGTFQEAFLSFFGCPRHWFYLGQNLLVHQSLTSKHQVHRPEGLIEETLSEAGSWQRDFDWQNTKDKHELAMLISLLLYIFRDQFMTCLFSLGVFSFERFYSLTSLLRWTWPIPFCPLRACPFHNWWIQGLSSPG